MRLVETLKSKTAALKVAEIAKLLGVTPQHIYKMAARGTCHLASGKTNTNCRSAQDWLG